jgi:sodium transport system permease protein
MYDLAREGDLMGKIIGMMVPFFIVIYLFANAMKVGLDTVAGEKERGTLATLLVNRVGRVSIVMGKMLSVMVAAIVGALSSMAGLKIASRQIIDLFSGPGEVPGGYAMTAEDLLLFAMVVIPLAILVASVVMAVSTFARNVKEGQGMITPVYIAVMVIGTTSMQSGDVPPRWMTLVPVFSSLTVMKQIFMDAAAWDQALFAGASSLLLSSVLILLTVRMFNDERILFRL